MKATLVCPPPPPPPPDPHPELGDGKNSWHTSRNISPTTSFSLFPRWAAHGSSSSLGPRKLTFSPFLFFLLLLLCNVHLLLTYPLYTAVKEEEEEESRRLDQKVTCAEKKEEFVSQQEEDVSEP